MTNEKSSMNVYKQINWKVMIPIMLFVTFQSAFTAFSSVLASIAEQFPNASATTIQMVLTLPSTMSIPVSLCAGLLASYFTKKQLIEFSLVVEFIGGMIPLVNHGSLGMLILSSCLIGLGQGIMITMASAIVGENFTGTTSGVAMGLKQAASSVLIAVFTIATGYLALSGWWHAYYVYFLAPVVLIITAVSLPKGQKDVRIVGKGAGSGWKKVLTRGVIYYSILSFFMAAANFAFYTNISFRIINGGLGDSASVGLASAWNQIVTVIISLIFGYILKVVKKYALAVAVGVQAISYLIIVAAPNLSVITIGGIVYGVGAAIQMVAACYYILESCDQDAASLGIAICMTLTSLGITFSPYVINAVAGIWGNNGITSGFLGAAVIQIVLVVVEVIYETVFNKDSAIGE